MKKLVYAFCILSLLLISCSGDTENIETSSDLVKQISFHGEGTNGRVYYLEYSADNRILKYDDGHASKKVFSYTGDLITKIDFYGYCDCGSGTGPYTLISSMDFEYDDQNRLSKFFVSNNLVEFDRVEFDYTGDGIVNYETYNNNELNHNGVIYFDSENANQRTDFYLLAGANQRNEFFYYYDSKKHVFSNVKGYKDLMLFNVFLGSIFDDGIAPNYGTSNNMISYVVRSFSNNTFTDEYDFRPNTFEYGTNNYPVKCTWDSQKIYLAYHF